ncbi:MAG: GNAT family N-acetyltransferase [Chloroflexota bacterium]|nr:GNAT family N-acetyltransferase [Chloroflexota bacterium]
MQISLETERLLLRPFTGTDANNLFDLDSDPDVMRYVNGGNPTPLEVVRNEDLPWFIEYGQRHEGYGFWAAIEKSTGEFVGWFLLRPPSDGSPDEPELGYRLRRSAWGKGYATEGSRVLVRSAFARSGVPRVVAFAHVNNAASRRVMEKVGMVLVRTFYLTWADRFDGVAQEAVEYALTRADWQPMIIEALHPAVETTDELERSPWRD